MKFSAFTNLPRKPSIRCCLENCSFLFFPALLAAIAFLLTACAGWQPVALARYLEHAEIQAETDAQRAVVGHALDDMLRLQAAKLRTIRYGESRSALPGLLRAHLVPSAPVSVEDEEFYLQTGDSRVRSAIETLKKKLQN